MSFHADDAQMLKEILFVKSLYELRRQVTWDCYLID